MAVRLINTAEMQREEWLAWRKRGIGSSDAAAICGLNPYKSAVKVWLEKTDQATMGDEQSESAYWGTILEDVVAREFTTRTGMKVRKRNAILQHPQFPFMLANIDREIVGGGVLECKTASEYMKDQWGEDHAPEMYQIQVLHQLAVTGEPFGYLAVLLGGRRFLTIRIERDEEMIQNLIQIERQFWSLVESNTPPAPDGSEASTDLIRRLYPKGKPEEVRLADDAAELIRQYEEARQYEAQWAERRTEAENKLKAMLGEYEVGLCGDRLVTWRTITSERLDSKALKTAHPDIYAQYTKASISRRFDIK